MLAQERALFVGDAVAAVFARHARSGQGRRRSDRDRLRAAADDHRNAARGGQRQRAALAAIAEQYLLHPRCRRPQGGRRGAGRRRAHKVSVTYADQPHHRGDDGGARRARQLRSGRREPTRCIAACRIRMPCATCWPTTSSGSPGNRIRVVAPDVGGGFGLKEAPFPEYVLAMIGAKRHRPAGAVDGGARRILSLRLPRPRQLLDRDARPRRAGPFPRAQGRYHRQYRRLYFAERAACLDQQSRRACRRLSHAAYPFAGDRHVLQHAADRALSRRRTAGGDLRDRARDRYRGAGAAASTRSNCAARI